MLDTNAEAQRALERSRSPSPVGGNAKRCFDLFVAGIAIFVLAPLLALIALAIKVNMGGPVVYSQLRIGYDGQAFRCLKFRSMRRDADEVLAKFLACDPAAADEWRATRKLRHDPRVTPLGMLLRRSSLDELPQLFNVIRGEMSCVGPRPIVSDELALYGVFATEYLRVRPGLTGLWQVGGRNDISYAARVALDGQYIRNWSFGADFAILLRTVPAVLRARGSY